ncbi:hypothetical protein CD351_13390 [Erythrobacter sp. KY5]|nr:hypothetical protein CD351_13390 [Erythrobacter sp. KY5]
MLGKSNSEAFELDRIADYKNVMTDGASTPSARTLEVAAAIIRNIAQRLEQQGAGEPPQCDSSARLGVASSLLEARELTQSIFGNVPVIHSPSWDILIDLFVSRKCDRKVSVTDACVAAGCPATTGLRWVQVLIDEGLVAKRPDPKDKRRTYLELTPIGLAKVECALDCYFKKVDPGELTF